MKIFSAVTFILFTYFSVVQYNDPDNVWWIILYAIVAVTALLFFFKKGSKLISGLGMLALLYALWLTTPGFIDWINGGAQQGIWGAMTDDKAYIEEVREFFGVVIAMIFQLVFVINSFRGKS